MLRPKLQRLFEVSFPAIDRLPWQSSDQIEGHVVESGIAQELERRADVGRIMCAAEHLQLAIIKRLRAKAGAVDSQAPPLAHCVAPVISRLAAIARINLDRHLRTLSYDESIVHRLKNRSDLLRR